MVDGKRLEKLARGERGGNIRVSRMFRMGTSSSADQGDEVGVTIGRSDRSAHRSRFERMDRQGPDEAGTDRRIRIGGSRDREEGGVGGCCQEQSPSGHLDRQGRRRVFRDGPVPVPNVVVFTYPWNHRRWQS